MFDFIPTIMVSQMNLRSHLFCFSWQYIQLIISKITNSRIYIRRDFRSNWWRLKSKNWIQGLKILLLCYKTIASLVSAAGFFWIKIIWWFFDCVYENDMHVLDFCCIYKYSKSRFVWGYIGCRVQCLLCSSAKKTPTSCICEYVVILE
jgi:hypothetical protein